MNQHHQILIVGGGTAGIMTAAFLKRKKSDLKISIIEPSKYHYYQAAWTLVGAGTFKYQDTRREELALIPSGVTWIKDYAISVDPEMKKVFTKESGVHTFDYLVLCPGLVMDMDALPGLKEALATDSVCSNYIDPEHTWKVIKNFKGGNAVFSQPSTPIKCGGAPQKIMYLAEEAFSRHGVRDKTKVIFAAPASVIFGVKDFALTLDEVIKRKKILTRFFYSPVKIDSVKKKIWFKYTKPDGDISHVLVGNTIGENWVKKHLIELKYDMLHIAPPQSAPDFIRNSSLAHQEGPSKGWLNVDIHSLQHVNYPSIYGIGDVAALPTAKTGAAVRKQVPVVVSNILNQIDHGFAEKTTYNGYSSCPLVTGYGKMVLAEFKYDNIRDSDPLLSKFWDTSKEQYSMWLLKKYGLPYLYWNKMMKGKMIE
ncbi:MAG: NAD(P)/FAD-dependent oxidoreductase [Bacteroidetes bacterium]|nr:NAD(P)/FAD-dependent oxidoreductase [Bacteroidota bacterium]